MNLKTQRLNSLKVATKERMARLGDAKRKYTQARTQGDIKKTFREEVIEAIIEVALDDSK
jgi:hypothetical protein